MNKLFFPLLAIVAALGLYFMYIRPTMAEIVIAEEKEMRFEQQVSEAKEVENILAKLEQDFMNISSENLAKLEDVLPKNIDMPRIIQNINAIVEKNNASILAVELESNAQSGNALYREHKVQVGFQAPYTTFVQILSDIESSLQLSNVSSIKIGRTEGRTSEIRAPYVVIFTFYQAI